MCGALHYSSTGQQAVQLILLPVQGDWMLAWLCMKLGIDTIGGNVAAVE